MSKPPSLQQVPSPVHFEEVETASVSSSYCSSPPRLIIVESEDTDVIVDFQPEQDQEAPAEPTEPEPQEYYLVEPQQLVEVEQDVEPQRPYLPEPADLFHAFWINFNQHLQQSLHDLCTRGIHWGNDSSIKIGCLIDRTDENSWTHLYERISTLSTCSLALRREIEKTPDNGPIHVRDISPKTMVRLIQYMKLGHTIGPMQEMEEFVAATNHLKIGAVWPDQYTYRIGRKNGPGQHDILMMECKPWLNKGEDDRPNSPYLIRNGTVSVAPPTHITTIEAEEPHPDERLIRRVPNPENIYHIAHLIPSLRPVVEEPSADEGGSVADDTVSDLNCASESEQQDDNVPLQIMETSESKPSPPPPESLLDRDLEAISPAEDEPEYRVLSIPDSVTPEQAIQTGSLNNSPTTEQFNNLTIAERLPPKLARKRSIENVKDGMPQRRISTESQPSTPPAPPNTPSQRLLQYTPEIPTSINPSSELSPISDANILASVKGDKSTDSKKIAKENTTTLRSTTISSFALRPPILTKMLTATQSFSPRKRYNANSPNNGIPHPHASGRDTPMPPPRFNMHPCPPLIRLQIRNSMAPKRTDPMGPPPLPPKRFAAMPHSLSLKKFGTIPKPLPSFHSRIPVSSVPAVPILKKILCPGPIQFESLRRIDILQNQDEQEKSPSQVETDFDAPDRLEHPFTKYRQQQLSPQEPERNTNQRSPQQTPCNHNEQSPQQPRPLLSQQHQQPQSVRNLPQRSYSPRPNFHQQSPRESDLNQQLELVPHQRQRAPQQFRPMSNPPLPQQNRQPRYIQNQERRQFEQPLMIQNQSPNTPPQSLAQNQLVHAQQQNQGQPLQAQSPHNPQLHSLNPRQPNSMQNQQSFQESDLPRPPPNHQHVYHQQQPPPAQSRQSPSIRNQEATSNQNQPRNHEDPNLRHPEPQQTQLSQVQQQLLFHLHHNINEQRYQQPQHTHNPNRSITPPRFRNNQTQMPHRQPHYNQTPHQEPQHYYQNQMHNQHHQLHLSQTQQPRYNQNQFQPHPPNKQIPSHQHHQPRFHPTQHSPQQNSCYNQNQRPPPQQFHYNPNQQQQLRCHPNEQPRYFQQQAPPQQTGMNQYQNIFRFRDPINYPQRSDDDDCTWTCKWCGLVFVDKGVLRTHYLHVHRWADSLLQHGNGMVAPQPTASYHSYRENYDGRKMGGNQMNDQYPVKIHDQDYPPTLQSWRNSS